MQHILNQEGTESVPHRGEVGGNNVANVPSLHRVTQERRSLLTRHPDNCLPVVLLGLGFATPPEASGHVADVPVPIMSAGGVSRYSGGSNNPTGTAVVV